MKFYHYFFSVNVSHFNTLSDFYVRQFDEFRLWDKFEKEIKNMNLPEVPKPWKDGIFIIFDKTTGKMNRLKFDSNILYYSLDNCLILAKNLASLK
jgi:hypothetical protein